ncbi:MAG: ATP-binding protein [Pseudomonadales bacterium]|nr:ATP-binding protein [Pseudomonadales bacterium]
MSIQQKLFLAFLMGSIALVTAMYGMMQWSFDQGMLDYVNQRELESQGVLAPMLAAQYQRHGSWQFLEGNHRLWRRLLARSQGIPDTAQPEPRDRPPPQHHRSQPPNLMPPPPNQPRPRIMLLNAQKQALFGNYNPDDELPLIPIEVDNQAVGYLTLAQRKHMSEAFELSFVKEQQTAFLMISAAVLIISICIAYPLAILFTRPIKQIATATHQLASGDYSLALAVSSDDELGKLIQDFNELASTLAANESARKRWIADISHELRTPLAICRGELEALIDAVRPLSKESIVSTHQEILRLQRLVEDLYELANADIGALSYNKESVDLARLLADQCDKLHHQAKLLDQTFVTDIPEDSVDIWGDPTRLSQLISNLLVNSIKYTDEKGTIQVSIRANTGAVNICIQDSPPQVNEQDLKKLFDPLFRVERSRTRETGGSGLGLAICKKIVEGHHGTIVAKPSSLGGLQIEITLPRKPHV